jgi:hypothetical protein
VTRAVALVALCASSALAQTAASDRAPAPGDFLGRAIAIERDLPGHPDRAAAALDLLMPAVGSASPAERRLIEVLDGQARVATGRTSAALELADRLDGDAARLADPGARIAALLIRSAAELAGGQSASAAAHARDARALAGRDGPPHLAYWADIAHEPRGEDARAQRRGAREPAARAVDGRVARRPVPAVDRALPALGAPTATSRTRRRRSPRASRRTATPSSRTTRSRWRTRAWPSRR